MATGRIARLAIPIGILACTCIAGRRRDARPRATEFQSALPHHRANLVDGMIMVMTPEAWTVIGTGIVVLIAISNRHLRAEMKAFRDELRGEMHGLRDEMNEKMNGLHGRMDQMHAEFGGLRERMAKLEGLLEGLREAITGRKAA